MRLWLIMFASLVLSACSSLPDTKRIPTHDLSHKIYFVYERWHTSIFIPAASVEQHSRYFADIAVQKNYLRFGYGDGDFFTGKSKTLTTGAKALVASDYSAVQVLDYWQDPLSQIPAETIVELRISEARMQKLLRYIDNSVELDERGKPLALIAYDDNTGYFYKGKQDYSVLSNCNTWSSLALQKAGIPIKRRLKLTAQSVFEQARLISEYQQKNLQLAKAESGSL
jgi:uncharacterized protein (TIGR02117 family)